MCSCLDQSFGELMHTLNITVPSDFISMCCRAIVRLKEVRKDVCLIYKFAKCIAVKQSNSEESLMPLNRMPFGLLQYQIDFFNAGHINQVRHYLY